VLLEGKVALVTGSANGIGLGIATRFAKEGAKVVICDMDEARLPEARSEIEEASGGEVLAVRTDVSKETEVEEFFKQAIARFGTLDILVNNAQIRSAWVSAARS